VAVTEGKRVEISEIRYKGSLHFYEWVWLVVYGWWVAIGGWPFGTFGALALFSFSFCIAPDTIDSRKYKAHDQLQSHFTGESSDDAGL
jgi:hypothetical protein